MSRVYVLGAGASNGYESGDRRINPPVAKEFFQAVAKLLNDSNGLHQDAFGALWNFLKRYYNLSCEDLNSCTLDVEEVLTVLDIGGTKRKARRQLLDLIALTLEKVIVGGPCAHHTRLVHSLHIDDAIITFNWDLLVDNIIAVDHEDGPNYGVDLLEPIKERTLPVGNLGNKPRLLKPHGSMNWMTCRTCRRSFAYILAGKTAARYHAGERVPCRYCGRPTEPLLIPPTLMKKYKHPVIKAVWDEAACVLRQATEIVIVGYSLPPTDFKAKWLFMEAAADRSRPLTSMTIFDLKPESLKPKFQRVCRVDEQHVRTVKGGISKLACELGHSCRET